MARRRIKPADGQAAIASVLAVGDLANQDLTQPVVVAIAEHPQLATAVRYLLEELAERAPGNSVEVRVPPFGATQCIEGPRHTRGTPPNTIELAPEIWFGLATGQITWNQALAEGKIHASGVRADISDYLPLI